MFNMIIELLKKDKKRIQCLKHIFLPLLKMHYVKIIENDRFGIEWFQNKIKESKLFEALK